ncbi:hypothetical protein [Mycolicibacterium palauense]|uniref:hypothetical protein n=1 Tax=Mycolicibacterium palauense TaxID=2034511 RepID=UPI000BFECEA9|nr:hypothetical protein [Mycolicibacterium palauense]
MRYLLTTKLYDEDIVTSEFDTRDALLGELMQLSRECRWYFDTADLDPVTGTFFGGIYQPRTGKAIGMYSYRVHMTESDRLPSGADILG